MSNALCPAPITKHINVKKEIIMPGFNKEPQYEVLSPWAEADPIPLRGIMPRITELKGKKIGFYSTSKRAAEPTLISVERKLRERVPGIETSFYASKERWMVPQIESKNREKFIEWVKGVDTVIAAVGD